MARPGRPERNRGARSFRQLRRFHHIINSDKVFGTHSQTLVSLTLASGEVPVMVALRLFLPDSWISDRRRLERAGVPAEYRTARTKPEIALAEIDRMISADVRFRCVLADAGYGLTGPFRQG